MTIQINKLQPKPDAQAIRGHPRGHHKDGGNTVTPSWARSPTVVLGRGKKKRWVGDSKMSPLSPVGGVTEITAVGRNGGVRGGVGKTLKVKNNREKR